MKPTVKTYANNDQVIIAWSYPKSIANCIGFAVYRRLNKESADIAEPVLNRVGFKNEPFEKGEQKPSTEWPIQRFLWTDFTVQKGDTVRYKIVPMVMDNGELIKDEDNASGWTNKISIDTGKNIQAFFNRGVVSSQFFSRMRNDLADELPGKSVKKIIEGPPNKVRNFLGGYLSAELFDILDKIIKSKNLTIFAALYELKQKDLIVKLKKIGRRANVILANGAFKKSRQDMNKESRRELRKAKVNVHNRIVAAKHFAHNKFLVICHNKKPQDVWSGSTNWTPGGLFSQVNNGILFKNNRTLAKHYINEWEALKDAGSEYTQELFDANEGAKKAGGVKVWFSPTPDRGDLDEAGKLMENAENGILFLMFNPGPKNTLFNKIIELQKDEEIYIHGIINQDPGASIKHPLIFFHRGEQVKTDWNSILPKKINKAFSFWYPESGSGFVTIHSKVVVIDPFGKKPIVITGSNNLGPKASGKNDENLLIIHNRRLAEEYAVNIMSVYEHYRWRYSLFHKNTKFKGLTRDPKWMKNYMNTSRFSELKFWTGK